MGGEMMVVNYNPAFIAMFGYASLQYCSHGVIMFVISQLFDLLNLWVDKNIDFSSF